MGSSSAPKSFAAPTPFQQFQPQIASPVKPAPVIAPDQNPPAPALLTDPGTPIQGASQPIPQTNQNPFSDVQSRLAAFRQARSGMGGALPFFG